ncbi:hypothetical protein FHW23_002033 [Curtobacterium pusillum]|uniref:Secreted protein n=1 Tax=Curtobacterium pusillum TaxID=69373 RepID=A0AAW3T989_9MICO|nr:hypothetical protein [Curtobacterium pusillum]MBA8990768.1 hypothetical protein [Curtobacterium pusillum]
MSAEWWAVIVAVLAAMAAVWQAFEARNSRREAQQSAESAAQNEKRALESSEAAASAATRSAEAQERLAELIEGQTAKPTWKVRRKNPTLFRVTNVSAHEQQFVTVEVEDDRLQVVGDNDDGFDSLGPGDGFDVIFDYRVGGRTFAAMTLLWLDERNDRGVERITLKWRPPAPVFVGF